MTPSHARLDTPKSICDETHPVWPAALEQHVSVNAFPSSVAQWPEFENVAVSVLGSDGQQLFVTVLELLDDIDDLDELEGLDDELDELLQQHHL